MSSPQTPVAQPSPAKSSHSLAFVLEALAFLAVIAAIVYLLHTNSSTAHWTQGYNPTGSFLISTLVAALPVVVLLGAIAILRLKAHAAALAGLITALAAATLVFHMPARLAFTAAAYGAGYGIFPIVWIILPVIFLYDLTVKTGRFRTLQQSLTGITADSRLQLLLIAFALGAFFEGTSGFGTPVAVCSAILISLGFSPLKAAGLSLLANTAPVAFGAMGIPLIALHGVTGLDQLALSHTTAVILLPFDILIPFWLIWAFAGFTAMLEVWPAILVSGLTFAAAQYVMATYSGPWLVAIVAAASTIVVLIVFLRFWQPRRVLDVDRNDITGQARLHHGHNAAAIFNAWLPWLVLSVVVFFWGLPRISAWMDAHSTFKIPIVGLHNTIQRVPPVVAAASKEAAVFNFNWLTATGTAVLIAALLAGLMMGLGPRTLAGAFVRTIFKIRYTIVTIAAMMALGYITRYCGLDATLGLAFARTGALYPFFGTLIGWLGTASTGSDTSSNVLFGSLQVITARQIGVSPTLMASANSAGGVMGKMIDAASIVVASTATNIYGQEGSILRFVFFHSLALAALVGIEVTLLAYVPWLSSLVAR
ncbi:MAG TPA: L-lactate permease [Terracidiphilus sp.]|nr:L-lactate permease [Terracidiphilus sp.]